MEAGIIAHLGKEGERFLGAGGLGRGVVRRGRGSA